MKRMTRHVLPTPLSPTSSTCGGIFNVAAEAVIHTVCSRIHLMTMLSQTRQTGSARPCVSADGCYSTSCVELGDSMMPQLALS
jgi:hypothetical protein